MSDPIPAAGTLPGPQLQASLLPDAADNNGNGSSNSKPHSWLLLGASGWALKGGCCFSRATPLGHTREQGSAEKDLRADRQMRFPHPLTLSLECRVI